MDLLQTGATQLDQSVAKATPLLRYVTKTAIRYAKARCYWVPSHAHWFVNHICPVFESISAPGSVLT